MKAIIIDDEKKSRNLLNSLIDEQFKEIKVIGLAKNAEEGLAEINKKQPDVVFLDINMPGKSGFDMLQEIEGINFQTIFVTAYDQYAIKAFKYGAFDYLLKPIDSDELMACIDRLNEKRTQSDFHKRLHSLLTQIEQPNQLPNRITIHSLDGITVIEIADIVYLEASGAYTLFYLKNKEKIVSSNNLKEYEDLLTVHHFFRVHHSYLVNLLEVKKYVKEDGGYVLMSDNSNVMVSKRKRDEFLRIL